MSTPTAFRENKGQVHDQENQPRWDVLYSGQAGGILFHIKRDGIHYILVEREETAASAPITFYRVDVDFVGGCARGVEAHHPLPWHENFYNVEGREVTGVRSYKEVRLHEVWDGVDIRFYEGKEGTLEYDFDVAPGASVEQIRLRIRGSRITLRNGELILLTPLGEIVEGVPMAWAGEKRLPAA